MLRSVTERSSAFQVSVSLVHIIRHGHALHNIDRNYPYRDPPLTAAGQNASKLIKIPSVPDLIVISPMTRTIQTAMNAFPTLLGSADTPSQVEVQIWPDLREAHDANCNKGLSRTELSVKFPQFDFTECSEEWDYPPHTIERATTRAEIVRQRLKRLSKIYKNIAIITHRGFIAFLVKGDRYDVCETRSYRFATEDEEAKAKMESARMGINIDTKATYDFGPTVLIPVSD
ncbi:hypothetical protein H072_10963 [Dactylellina haptotyla CBS 200.50]|uniref:Phosphoglycerate mutase-like protein n=1 Tax=Dactylellina haptotyla (strain CBS 200.50) TaxID=1284197 RepID=S8BK57_DACHA|nr:hypothetical protein H072_10963 [Dactylellina haptotyla CBS 200.50]